MKNDFNRVILEYMHLPVKLSQADLNITDSEVEE